MTQRDWIEKDFYRELGVASDASTDEIKKAYRKLAREIHPDANPGDAKAEARFKSVSEAYGVLSDPEKRKEYDETRALFGRAGAAASGGPAVRHRRIRRQSFDLSDLFGNARAQARPGGRRRARRPVRRACSAAAAVRGRPRARQAVGGRRRRDRGHDRLRRGRARRRRCRCGCRRPAAARPAAARARGRAPARAPARRAPGPGWSARSQGAFAFSEPCRDCRGTGRIIDDPCPECGGDGREHPHPHADRARSRRGGGRQQGSGWPARASRAGAGRPRRLYVACTSPRTGVRALERTPTT